MKPRITALASLALGVISLVFVVSCSSDDTAATSTELTFVDGIATSTPDAANPPQRDIEKPLPCRVEIDALRAGGKITNHSDAPADYMIIVVWEQDGTQLATNSSLVDDVAPGLTSSFEVTAPGEGTLRTTCRVKQVDRTPSK
ncbi:MAG TPA: hypothetical protein VFD53_07665 [Ilumatobacter sp.]|nr:hypothetical protein [Ilumatobacter sp.]